MEFLKKNYQKMVLAAITLAGTILFIVLLVHYNAQYYGIVYNPTLGIAAGEDPYNAWGALFGYVAALTFFATLTVFFVISMFKKAQRVSKFSLIATGVLCTLFMITAMVLPLYSDSYALSREIINGERNARIQMYVQAEVVSGAIAASGNTDLSILIDTPLNEWYRFEGTESLRAIVEENVAQAIQEAQDMASYRHLQGMVMLFSQLLLFGVLPLGVGIKKLLTKDKEVTE